MNAPRDLPSAALHAGTAGVRHVPSYCYQCVAGPDLLTVKVVDGVATEIEPNFCAADIHPGARQGLRQGVRAGAEDLPPGPRRDADEAHQSPQGPRRGPGVRADLLGRGARSRRGQAARDPRRGRARRIRLSARGRDVRRRRDAAGLHGHVPRVPLGLGHRSTWASARGRASSATTPSTCTASTGTARSSSRRTRRAPNSSSRAGRTSRPPAAWWASRATPTPACAA